MLSPHPPGCGPRTARTVGFPPRHAQSRIDTPGHHRTAGPPPYRRKCRRDSTLVDERIPYPPPAAIVLPDSCHHDVFPSADEPGLRFAIELTAVIPESASPRQANLTRSSLRSLPLQA